MTAVTEARLCAYCGSPINGGNAKVYCSSTCCDLALRPSKNLVYGNVNALTDEDRETYIMKPLRSLNEKFHSNVMAEDFIRSLELLTTSNTAPQTNEEFRLVAYLSTLMSRKEYYMHGARIYNLAKKSGVALLTKKFFNKHFPFILNRLIDFNDRCDVLFKQLLEENEWVRGKDDLHDAFKNLSTWTEPAKGGRHYGNRDWKLSNAIFRHLCSVTGQCEIKKGDGLEILNEYCTADDFADVEKLAITVEKTSDVSLVIRTHVSENYRSSSVNATFLKSNGESYVLWIPYDDFIEWIEIISSRGRFHLHGLIPDLVENGHVLDKSGKAVNTKQKYQIYAIKRILDSIGLLDSSSENGKELIELNVPAIEAIERVLSIARRVVK